MSGNPFDGTEFEQDWVNGFQAGLVAPNVIISAPSPLVLEAQEAFNQGVSSGQMVNAALEPPLEIEAGYQGVVDIVHEGVDILGPLVSLCSEAIRKASESGSTFAAAFRAGALGAGTELLFNMVMLVAIWGPHRDDFFSDAVSARLEEIRQEIAANGIANDNLELFMAVCADQVHQSQGSDPVSKVGVWHGLFRLDFDTAAQDAAEHEHAAAVRIHRYQTAQPTLVEILTVG